MQILLMMQMEDILNLGDGYFNLFGVFGRCIEIYLFVKTVPLQFVYHIKSRKSTS